MINVALSVDDENIVQMLNQMIFSRTSFCKKFQPVMNGSLAIDFYENLLKQPALDKAEIPVIIFLDINMPVLDGWGFLEKFQQLYYQSFPQTKVVIVSSSVDPSDYEKATSNPLVIGFINKPLTMQAIDNLKTDKHLKSFFN